MWKFLANFLHRSANERDLDEELRSYVDALVKEKVQAGMSAEEAERTARIEFGGIEQVKEQVRDARPGAWLDGFLQDLRYAVRCLSNNRGFSAVAIISLALGIGANCALFSVLNAVLLRALPVAHPEQLFELTQAETRYGRPDGFSYPIFERMRNVARGDITAMSRVAHVHTAVDGGTDTETRSVQLVSGSYFGVLGIFPVIGRALTSEDNRGAGQPIAVISHDFWQRRFGGSSSVLGRSLTLNGAHVTIVGVAPAGFTGVWLESPTEIWIPLALQAAVHYGQNYSASDGSDPQKPWLEQEEIRWLNLVVRNKTSAGALDAVFRQSAAQEAAKIGDPQDRRLFLRQHLEFDPIARGFSKLREQYTEPLFALMAMVALVLLIACANTANLLLARSNRRQREMALRLALGASRRRLIRQLLTESFLLAAIAAAAGLAIANVTSQLLIRGTTGAAQAPIRAGIDARVLGFTAALALLVTILFGLAPAFRATRGELESTLKTTARGVHWGARFNAQKLLVASQMALTLILVVGALWFAESLRNLANLNLGFDQEHVISVQIDPQSVGFPADRIPQLYRRLVASAQAVPGVRSAAIAMCGLEAGCRSTSDIQIAGYRARRGEQIYVQENYVGLDYFPTVGMRLDAGRDFTAHDDEKAPRVAIVNEAFVRRYLPNGAAIGARFGYGGKLNTQIVGVIEDARVNSAREEPPVMAYYPLTQQPEVIYAESLDVRVTGDPVSRVADIRKAVAAVDRELPINRVTPLYDQVSGSLRQDRLIMWLTSTFGALALGLASFGMYGVMSYTVARRTAELGIRLALGAPQGRLFWTVLAESLGLAAAGLAIGIPCVLAAARVVAGMLVDVKPDDPVVVCTAAAGLAAVAALAAYLPAWRAAHVDPVVALRHE
ncbi:MAG TPA: ABC transporter permease [Bryobacteraceae bacterium]|nr:ABC transporter permease [Bryobacteraceae bacterium]